VDVDVVCGDVVMFPSADTDADANAAADAAGGDAGGDAVSGIAGGGATQNTDSDVDDASSSLLPVRLEPVVRRLKLHDLGVNLMNGPRHGSGREVTLSARSLLPPSVVTTVDAVAEAAPCSVPWLLASTVFVLVASAMTSRQHAFGGVIASSLGIPSSEFNRRVVVDFISSQAAAASLAPSGERELVTSLSAVLLPPGE
jgi:hypothetical protein